jgi:chemotaxis receptor (MCP) glutamine deamidase CheD
MTALALADAPFSLHPGLRGQEMRIRINPGGHYVTSGNELLVTVLGSCVAACIRDPVAGVGGMNHFMLPESDSGRQHAVWQLRNGATDQRHPEPRRTPQ